VVLNQAKDRFPAIYGDLMKAPNNVVYFAQPKIRYGDSHDDCGRRHILLQQACGSHISPHTRRVVRLVGIGKVIVDDFTGSRFVLLRIYMWHCFSDSVLFFE
jgi:hypothetical protein